jgi:hypothetical protein
MAFRMSIWTRLVVKQGSTTTEFTYSAYEDWNNPLNKAPRTLRLNKAKDAGLIPERAYCQVRETEDIATQLRH